MNARVDEALVQAEVHVASIPTTLAAIGAIERVESSIEKGRYLLESGRR